MRHRKDKKTLDRSRDSRNLLIRTMTNQLLQHGSINTTLVKGKVIQRTSERLIKIGKINNLAHLRQLVGLTNDRNLSQKIVKHISPKYSTRPGGYTRIIRLGNRAGDGAMKVKVMLVE